MANEEKFENNEEKKPEQNQEIAEEEEIEMFELVDEEGNTTVFEHLGTFEFNGKLYLAAGLVDEEQDEEEDDMEVVILRIETDEDGNDIYVTPDQEEADAAFECFEKMVLAANEEEEEK